MGSGFQLSRTPRLIQFINFISLKYDFKWLHHLLERNLCRWNSWSDLPHPIHRSRNLNWFCWYHAANIGNKIKANKGKYSNRLINACTHLVCNSADFDPNAAKGKIAIISVSSRSRFCFIHVCCLLVKQNKVFFWRMFTHWGWSWLLWYSLYMAIRQRYLLLNLVNLAFAHFATGRYRLYPPYYNPLSPSRLSFDDILF